MMPPRQSKLISWTPSTEIKSAQFSMKVEELNYNLRNIDSNLENQVYYSNTSLPTATTLAQVTVAGASNQTIVRKKFDDPTTTEDESTQEKDKLSPGFRIELSPTLFQSYLLDKEGDSSLSSSASFSQVLKGIVISSSNFSQDLLAQINLKNAKIEVIYTYLYKKRQS